MPSNSYHDAKFMSFANPSVANANIIFIFVLMLVI